MTIQSLVRRAAFAIVASAPLLAGLPAGAQQQQVQIAIDGTPVAVAPAPVIRGGRVFVPLRSVFEQLRASVVYDAGAIDATSSDGRAIAMHLGSTQASVDGTPQTIDVAPFLIGDSTFVPLRFLSQALGANVSWDGSQQLVAIDRNGQQAYATAQPAGIPSYAYDDSYMNEAPPPLPDYEQPPVPAADTIWQPGYWAASSNTGYFWVPGTWVPAPQTNLLWTPPYWSFANGSFGFHPGYWSQAVGYYGGINYGNGYYGDGYNGGRWQNNAFNYNTAVTNVTNVTVIKNVYIDKKNVAPARVRTSYSGGPHGVQSTPPPAQSQTARAPRVPMTPIQREHLDAAAQDRRNFATVNGGSPPIAAVAKPYSAAEKPAGAETPAPEDKIEAQKTVAHPAPLLEPRTIVAPHAAAHGEPLRTAPPKPAFAQPLTGPQPTAGSAHATLPVHPPLATMRPKFVHPRALDGGPKTPPPLNETLRPKFAHPVTQQGSNVRTTILPVQHSAIGPRPKPKATIEPK